MSEPTPRKRGRYKNWRSRVGDASGRLTIIAEAPQVWSCDHWIDRWLCRCACGTYLVARSIHLNGKHTVSCGCKKREQLAFNRHNFSLTHPFAYRSWLSMHSRCYKPRTPGYERYGGRGIVVCERWHVLANFIADMGERAAELSIERKNTDGNYCPGNCVWATKPEQSRNRTATKLTLDTAQELLGRREIGEAPTSIARRLGVSVATVYDVWRGTSWKELERPWLR